MTFVLIFMVFVLTGILIYGNTFSSPFVMDDYANITENPAIRMNHFTVQKVLKALQLTSAYRPLPCFSFALNYFFHEYRVAGYHLVNIAIHIVTGFLVFLVARQTMRLCGMSSAVPPLLAAMLWFVNPVHNQSVTYIVQRMTSMATMFYMLSLWIYIKARSEGSATQKRFPVRTVLLSAASIIAGICALGSKQIAATLPVIIFFYEWYFFRNINRTWLIHRIRWLVALGVVVSAIALIYLGTTPFEKIQSMYAHQNFTITQRLFTEPRVILFYLVLMFYPHPDLLSIDHHYPISYALHHPPTTIAALIALAGLISAAIISARREKLISFAIIWFLGNLVIESSLIGLALIFQHRTYLPFIFPVITISWLAFQYLPARKYGILLFCVVIGIFSLWTFQRNQVWKNRFTFWQDTVAKAPYNGRARNDLGLALMDNGKMQAAIAELKKAVDTTPDNVPAHNNLGLAFTRLGQLDKAISFYEKALSLGPGHPQAYANLGATLLMDNRPEEAITVLEKGIQVAPDVVEIHDNLANAYMQANKPVKAKQHAEKALDLMPGDPIALNVLGLIFSDKGDYTQAIQYFKRALKKSPLNLKSNLHIARIYMMLNQPVMATPYLQAVIQINPANAFAHGELGAAYALSGKPAMALRHLQKAIELNPGDAVAHFNLGNVLTANGNLKDALAHYNAALAINPDYTEARLTLGKVLLHHGDIEEATHQLDTLTNTSKDPQLLYRIATLYKKYEILNNAATLYEKAIDIEPAFPQCLDNLGSTYVRLGRLEDAVQAYRRLKKLMPDAATVPYNLACVYALQGRKEDAVAAIKEARSKGYNDLRRLLSDPDLATLQDTEYYKKLKNAWESGLL